jgi:hypothetical protein
VTFGCVLACSRFLVGEEDGVMFVRLRPTDGATTQAVFSVAGDRSRTMRPVVEELVQLAQLPPDSESRLG